MTMYPAMVNSPVTELAEAIDETQNTINLLSGDALPAAPNLATIGDGETAETVLYNGKSGNTLTGVVRGFQGAARSWGVGNPVARLFTAYDHDTMVEHVNNQSNPHKVTTEQVNKIAAKLVSDLPSAYPDGISMFNLSSTDAEAWKTATGYVGFARAVVETTKVGGTDYIIVQRVTFDNAGTVVYERSSDANNSWTGAWVKVVSRSEFDTVNEQLAEKAPNLGIATQAQAEAGIANNVYMSPLRTAQAIAALSPAPDVEWRIGASGPEWSNDGGGSWNTVAAVKSIQRGSTAFSVSGAADAASTVDVTIAAVNMNKTNVDLNTSAARSGSGSDSYSVSAELTSPTNLRITSYSSSGNQFKGTVKWEVTEHY